jgi:uncharacterized protein YycO
MQLKKYDIILKKNGTHPISKLIHFFTQDIYNHSEIYIGNYHIIDAMPNGVKVRNLDCSLGEFDAFRYKGTITKAQGEKIEEFLQKNINTKYDFLQLIFQALNLNIGSPRKYICIELVIEAFRYAGIPIGTWQKGFKQITNSEFFKKI